MRARYATSRVGKSVRVFGVRSMRSSECTVCGDLFYMHVRDHTSICDNCSPSTLPGQSPSGRCSLKLIDLVLRQDGLCYYCKRKFTPELRPILEHYIALSRGGVDDDANLVAACRSCNSRKGNRNTQDFIAEIRSQ